MEVYAEANFVPMADPDISCLTSSHTHPHTHTHTHTRTHTYIHSLPVVTLYKVTKCKEKVIASKTKDHVRSSDRPCFIRNSFGCTHPQRNHHLQLFN